MGHYQQGFAALWSAEMNALWIGWKSFRQHAAAGCLSVFCLAVAGGLVMSGRVLKPGVEPAATVAMLAGGAGLWAAGGLVLMRCLVCSVSRRRREIAVLRALGAGRGTIFSSVLAEGLAMAATGVVGSFFSCAALVGIPLAVDKTLDAGINIYAAHGVYLWAPSIILLTGMAGGICGGMAACRTDVAGNLDPK